MDKKENSQDDGKHQEQENNGKRTKPPLKIESLPLPDVQFQQQQQQQQHQNQNQQHQQHQNQNQQHQQHHHYYHLSQAKPSEPILVTDKNKSKRDSSDHPKESLSDGNSSSGSLTANTSSSSIHQKQPSVHAHFLLNDVVGHGGSRSRSSSVDNNIERGGGAANEKKIKEDTIRSNTPSEVSTGDPRLPQNDGKIHILLGATGTISAGKLRLIIQKLEKIYGKDKVSIQLILTAAAEGFVSRSEIPNNVIVWGDEDEWKTWQSRSDPVLHIELRKWADILVVAPLTANTLGKIALGLCDNLLTNVIRAWNIQYPILIAPAMLSYAYSHPATKRHLDVIKNDMKWIEILKPVEKVVGTFGDIGMGGMMDWNGIVDRIVIKLGGYPKKEDEEEDEEKNENDEDEDEEEEDDEEQHINSLQRNVSNLDLNT